jgi:sugar O-acyltransferase (sialic acid O-acetyltransferase NeuD family)
LKKRPPLLLIGAGGHALACIGVVEAEKRFQIAGLVGQKEEVGRKILGYSVLGTDKDLPRLVRNIPNILIAIGQIKTPIHRQKAYEKAGLHMVRFPVIRSPFSCISARATLGEGTFVMPGTIVQAGARVGKNCILNSQCLLEHGVQVGDHCHVSTGAILNGDVKVGSGSFVGSGAVIQEGTVIRSNSVVPMGTVVRRR